MGGGQDLTYKSHTGRGGSHCTSPCSLNPPLIYWDFKAVDLYLDDCESPFLQLIVFFFVGVGTEMFFNLWTLCLCLCFYLAEARIWAWMLNMPHSPPKAGGRTLRESSPAAKAAAVSHSGTKRARDASLLLTSCFVLHQFQHPPCRFLPRPRATTTGPVDGVSPAIGTLASASPCEGRASTAGGTPSASADSAACSASVTAASPTDKKVRGHLETPPPFQQKK